MGVMYYNEKHGTNVEVLGWDLPPRPGSFTGNFESTDDGRIYGQTLMDEGADIIMPVAGPVGLGTAAAIQERGNAWIIGVDTDWTVSASQYAPITFTSVLKKMDVAVFDASKAVQDGTFAGGFYSGTLANGGVDIAPVAAGTISDELRAELDQVKADIIAGTIKTAP
jgi:basic membrane protein A and related proteins